MTVSRMDRVNLVLKHVYTEPKFVAQIEWSKEHPGLSMQLEAQLGRGALEQFVGGGGWPDPERKVSFVVHEPPDWDWWEPRHDQPWRREQARDRELDRMLAKARAA